MHTINFYSVQLKDSNGFFGWLTIPMDKPTLTVPMDKPTLMNSPKGVLTLLTMAFFGSEHFPSRQQLLEQHIENHPHLIGVCRSICELVCESCEVCHDTGM